MGEDVGSSRNVGSDRILRRWEGATERSKAVKRFWFVWRLDLLLAVLSAFAFKLTKSLLDFGLLGLGAAAAGAYWKITTGQRIEGLVTDLQCRVEGMVSIVAQKRRQFEFCHSPVVLF